MKPLDERYLTWLYSQVGPVRLPNSSTSYWNLFRLLHNKEFTWFIPNDDNRAADGCDLRYEFLECHRIKNADPGWSELGCSMLELLVGLSKRLFFEDDRDPRYWFWQLLANLDLDGYSDRTSIPEREVNECLDRVINRTYNRDGSGGLFPLRRPNRDQRKVELWYQLSAYLLESE